MEIHSRWTKQGRHESAGYSNGDRWPTLAVDKGVLNATAAWPSGKALGCYVAGPRFESTSTLLSLQKLWSVDTVL